MDSSAGFAQHLRALREGQGLSVRALANRVGVSSVTIWKWERGDSKPRPNLLLTLARALDISPLKLSGGPDAGDEPAGRPDLPAAGDVPVPPTGEGLADVIARAKQMIADASGTGTNNITILIEY